MSKKFEKKQEGYQNKGSRKDYKGKSASRSDAELRDKYDSITRPHNCNDINWYVHDAHEARQIGSFTYAPATGVTVNADGTDFDVTGLAVMETTPMYGFSDGPDSPINIAIRKVYSEMRAQNSGSANYTATQYGFYLMAFDSIYYIMQHISRAFSIYHTYSTYNRYLPKVLLNEMGFSFADIAKNYPQYVARYNNIARAVAVWNIPRRFPIFERHSYLFSGVLRDSDSPKDQMYVHKPTVYYTYEEVADGSLGSKLEAHQINIYTYSYHEMDRWFDIVDECLSKVLASSTMQIMNGDSAKAFNDFYKVSLITGEEPLAVITDEKARLQIANSTPVGQVFNLDIEETVDESDYSEDFFYIYHPTISKWGMLSDADNTLINTNSSEVSAEETIEITRNIMSVTGTTDTAGNAEIGMQLPDAIEKIKLITINGESSSEIEFEYFNNFTLTNSGDIVDHNNRVRAYVSLLTKMRQFDYLPRIKVRTGIQDGNGNVSNSVTVVSSQVTNFTTISVQSLKNIANIAIQRLFGY